MLDGSLQIDKMAQMFTIGTGLRRTCCLGLSSASQSSLVSSQEHLTDREIRLLQMSPILYIVSTLKHTGI